jgi:hypothetical protein
MTMSVPQSQSAAPVTEPGPQKEAAAAFEKLLPEMEQLRDEEVLTINLDIPRAASMAIGALPGLVALRPRMVSEAPQFRHREARPAP